MSRVQEEMDGNPFVAGALVVGLGLIWFWNSIYIIKEWERGVVLRLGRLNPDAKNAGLRLVLWPIEDAVRIPLRIETLDVPPQDIITRDNVSVKVNAVCYFRVVRRQPALSQVQNYTYATSQLAQTTIRSVVGQFELDEILSQRDKVNAKLQIILDTDTEPWGIKVCQSRGEARRSRSASAWLCNGAAASAAGSRACFTSTLETLMPKVRYRFEYDCSLALTLSRCERISSSSN